jgi:hypothetical protein
MANSIPIPPISSRTEFGNSLTSPAIDVAPVLKAQVSRELLWQRELLHVCSSHLDGRSGEGPRFRHDLQI